MPNRYFNNIINLLTGTKARAADVEADFTAVSAGLDIVQAEMDAKAPIASPNFSGIPTAPTAPGGTNTTQIATCQFVLQQALSTTLPGQAGNAGKALVTDGTNASWQSVTASWSTLTGKPTTFAGFGFSASQSRIDIGITTTGDAVVTAASQSAARTAIGASTVGSAIMIAADAPAVRVAAGVGATGDTLFTAGTATAARTALGAGATGDALFTAANALAARTAIGITLGTAANNVVQLDGSGRLPAVDGSLLTGISTQQPGEICYFARNTAPTGFLKANGALVSRTTYASLFAAIGTTFGVGDGSTTFGLPDLRGEFIRGWDDARGVDSGRVFGNVQSGDIQNHTHTLTIGTSSGGAVNGLVTNTSLISTGGTYIAAAGGTETRPRNVSLLACIKF